MNIMMDVLNWLYNKISPRNKIRIFFVPKKPVYSSRHKGKDFLILGTGGSISKYGDQIKKFIEDNQLITIGINGVFRFFDPDYLAIYNRGRFVQYGEKINKDKSVALLSCYFSDNLIKRHNNAKYELAMYIDHNDTSLCYIDDEYIVHHTGASISRSILIAHVMGAKNIYVAGADGLSSNDQASFHFHNDKYKGKTDLELQDVYRDKYINVESVALSNVFKKLKKTQKKPFVFITPTSHGDYYDESILKKYVLSKEEKE